MADVGGQTGAAAAAPSGGESVKRTLLKLLLVGESGVGKTSLLLRYSEPGWDPRGEPAPITGADTKVVDTKIDGRDVRLQIWDTAGQEKFRVITSTFYKVWFLWRILHLPVGAHGVLAVYDVTSRETFETIPNWMGEVDRYCQAKVARVVVANKVDLKDQREVSKEDGENAAASTGESQYMETDMYDAAAVNATFTLVARMALAEVDAVAAASAPKQNSVVPPSAAPGTVFKVSQPEKQKSCCSIL